MRVGAVAGLLVGMLVISGIAGAAPADAQAPPKPIPRPVQSTPTELAEVDIIGGCQSIGFGILNLHLICGNTKVSGCGRRFSKTRAAGAVISKQEVWWQLKIASQLSLTADVLNTAAYRSCDDGSPVLMKRIQLKNTFTVSGLQLDSCTVTVKAEATMSFMPSMTGGAELSCTIKTREDVFGENIPASCVDCADLNSDVYQFYARWSFGAPTRYMHQAEATFTSYSGSRLKVTSVVDAGF